MKDKLNMHARVRVSETARRRTGKRKTSSHALRLANKSTKFRASQPEDVCGCVVCGTYGSSGVELISVRGWGRGGEEEGGGRRAPQEGKPNAE
jgi:hypothetical protein